MKKNFNQMYFTLIELLVVIAIIAILASMLLPAAELPGGVQFNQDGSFRVGDAEFSIQNYSPSWSPSANGSWKDRREKLGKNGLSLSATMRIGAQPAAVTKTITPTGENSFTLKFDAKFAEKTTINALHGVFMVPAGAMTITVDGKSGNLPADYKEMTVYGNSKAKIVRFEVAGDNQVTVSGNPLKLAIQDNRKFGGDTFAFRFGATPSSGQMTEAALALDFKEESVKATPVDLSNAANRGFADETADDGKGGWTDQGPENDLRMLKPGTVKVDSLPFEVFASGAVVTAGKMRSFPNASASLALPQNQAGAVNLLHASAWTPKTGETLDDKAVADSDSVLVIQLTNLSNTGLVFGNEAKKLVTKTGALPLLVYKGSATVGLASRRPYKVTAINCDGVPCGPVEGSCKDGVFRFKAETSLFPGGVMACHLTR